MSPQRLLNILFADDAADSRMLVQACLRGAPVTLTGVEDGLKAIEAYESFEFDLILMDIEMPVVTGPEALARIRKWETAQGLPPVPAIALTGNDEAAGFDFHLKKPVKKADLLEMIGRIFPTLQTSPVPTSADTVDSTLDEEIREMMPGYLENRGKDLVSLTSASASGDLQQCAALLHRIKGTAASYGFKELGQLAELGEKHAKAGDAASLILMLRSYRSELARQLVLLPKSQLSAG